MFFDGSTRSDRRTTRRSPTTSASASDASRVSGSAAICMSASTSGPSAALNGCIGTLSPRIARVAATYDAAQRLVWNPAGPLANERQSSSATSVGSSRMPSGPQNGVCMKWTIFRSGRRARSCAGTSASW
jgi:hypothetical protein